MSIVDEIKESFKQGGALTRLIYINLGVFVVIRVIYAILALMGGGDLGDLIISWLSVPAHPSALLFRPWTIITYMFLHVDLIHILVNILYLYWFGRIFLNYFNPRQLLGVYFMGGIAGAALYILSYNIFPGLNSVAPSAVMMGASASVMAILFSAARYTPNLKVHLMFLGSVKLMHIALIMLVLDLISISNMSNTGGHLAHIGGALFGVFYASRLQKGKDTTLRFNRWMDKVATLFSRKNHMKVTHSSKKRPMSDMEYNSRKNNNQHNVDRILDKIKSKGYDSLSDEEKRTLFDASDKN